LADLLGLRWPSLDALDLSAEDDYLNQCYMTILSLLSSQICSHCYKVIWLGISLMAIIHYSLFAALPSSPLDFQKAIDFYVGAPSTQLQLDVEKAFQESVTEADSSKLFDMVMKNVLGPGC